MFDLRKSKRNNDIFDDAFGTLEDTFNNLFGPVPRSVTLSPMKVDVQETDVEYVIEAEIAGVNKEDIKVDLVDNVLSITVNHEEKTEESKENYILKERRNSTYNRKFYVDNVVRDSITAKYVNGVLTLNLPKVKPDTKENTDIKID